MTRNLSVKSDRLASVAELAGTTAEELEGAFVCEEWRADLATGLIELGMNARAHHETNGATCGIMDMIRLYHRADWPKILLAFEEAAGISTSFSFATTIVVAPGVHRPLFCLGVSQTDEMHGGTIDGIFAISRVCFDINTGRPNTIN
jgi:hypothetical protein